MMKTVSYQVLVQMMGALGVIASLLFVGFEIKQSRDIALADIYQSKAELELAVMLSTYSPEQLRPALEKMTLGEEQLTQSEIWVIWDMLEASMITRENAHYQYTLGLLTEDEWQAKRRVISFLMELQCFSEYWQRSRAPLFRDNFVADIADIVANAPKHTDCSIYFSPEAE